MNDMDYMRLTLELAQRGCGWTSPIWITKP